ncbi:MAG: CDP-alcohol phosphatidyltransferase family protein [Halobacteriaceae archaeon]
MTLDRYRHLADRALDPFVAAARRLGLGPDGVSVAAALLAGAAAVGFYLGGTAGYLAGALLVAANGWLDLVDGALARDLGRSSARGDLLDHVLDRYADIAVIAGFAAGVGRYDLGLAAVTGVLMTSYLGTQGQAVGLERVYAGVLGRADRLALAGVVGGVAALVPAFRTDLVLGLLVVFAVVGHLTALQRFRGALRALD